MKARSHSTPSGRRGLFARSLGVLGAAALFSVAGLSGCVGYSSYPNVEGAKMASTNPNLYSSRECMAVALGWVITKFPPSTPATSYGNSRALINLVPGMNREMYIKVADKVSAATNIEVSPIEPGDDDSGLPIYHVARVWLRHGDAKVDVLRPMPELGLKDDGQPVYQCITVILSGGFQPWLVKATHTREPGLVEVPPLYFLPEEVLPGETQPAAHPSEQTPGAAPSGEMPSGEATGSPSGAGEIKRQPPPGTTEVLPASGEPKEPPPVDLPENPK